MADCLPDSDAAARTPRPALQAAGRRQNRVCVLGIPLDLISLSAVARHIANAAAAREPLFISTANLNFLALSQRSPAFRRSLWESQLCTADGIAIVILCRLLGITIPERVAGSDFLPALAAAAAPAQARPLTIFFFGGTSEAGRAACDTVNGWNSPNLCCLGHLSPGFGSIEEMSSDSVIAAINRAGPDFLVVSLGAEKGQSWILHNRQRFKAPVVSHLGATINFLAGSVRRAPRAIQAAGLEWLWRIKEERHLAARYWNDGLVLARLLLTRVLPLGLWLFQNRRRWRNAPLGITIAKQDRGRASLILTGTATSVSANALAEALSEAMNLAPHVDVDLGALHWADLHAMACFQDASAAAEALGSAIVFSNVVPNLRKGMSLNGLEHLLSG